MNKIILTSIFFVIFFGGSVTSPNQQPLNTNKEIQNKEFKELKDSIISCVIAAKKSQEVVELNEGYLENMDRKIDRIKILKHKKPSKNTKGVIIIPQEQISIKVFHIDSTCIKKRNWVGRTLNTDTCRTYKIDTVWATLKQ